MRKMTFIAVAVAAMAAVVLAGTVVRNDLLDRGAAALKREDGASALRYLLPLARLGDSKAQELVGLTYALGIGVPKDDRAAITWFRRAGSSIFGHSDTAADSAFYVAMTFRGEGDANETVKWLQIAADEGSNEAATMLKRTASSTGAERR